MPSELESTADPAATEVDTYRLIQPLTPDRTFLCSDASSNVVVLVRLEDDCLHRKSLHPSIRDRLARVRELPHPRVATLRGVERWNNAAFMVWIYLDGDNWDDFLRQHPETFPVLTSGLAASLLALHDLGIVHGNLHGRNIIVRPDGQPWMTQLSPYLYADPTVDLAAFSDLLAAGRACLSMPAQSRLSELIGQLDAKKSGLREISRALLKLGDADPADDSVENSESKVGHRRTSLAVAIVIAFVAISTALAIYRHFSNSEKPELSRPAPGNFKTSWDFVARSGDAGMRRWQHLASTRTRASAPGCRVNQSSVDTFHRLYKPPAKPDILL